MTTDAQVRLMMRMLKKGLSLMTAAAKAGMSEGTARKYRGLGKLPCEARVAHTWRTREDPFEGVWPEVEELLEADAGLDIRIGSSGWSGTSGRPDTANLDGVSPIRRLSPLHDNRPYVTRQVSARLHRPERERPLGTSRMTTE